MPKRAVSAKLDDFLLQEADRLARKFKVPRNRAVEEGLQMWVDQKSRELLALKMKEASLSTRKESRQVSEEWSISLNDGLPPVLKEDS